jgi:hypothetical protein
MSAEAADLVDLTPSALAVAHARARHACELCGVKNFSIGGRNTAGTFRPLFQSYPDPAEARAMIGELAWCGVDDREFVTRIFRVVCHVVRVTDSRHDITTLLLCGRCVAGVRETATVEAAE